MTDRVMAFNNKVVALVHKVMPEKKFCFIAYNNYSGLPVRCGTIQQDDGEMIGVLTPQFSHLRTVAREKPLLQNRILLFAIAAGIGYSWDINYGSLLDFRGGRSAVFTCDTR